MKFKATSEAALNRNLDLLIRSKIIPPLGRAVDKACSIVLAEAQRLVPVASGELRNSGTKFVKEEGRTVTGTVAFTAEHAGFIEFGTGIRGRGTYPGPLPQTGVPITGQWIYDYRNQNWQGMVSQAYLRPALDASRIQILAEFRKLF